MKKANIVMVITLSIILSLSTLTTYSKESIAGKTNIKKITKQAEKSKLINKKIDTYNKKAIFALGQKEPDYKSAIKNYYKAGKLASQISNNFLAIEQYTNLINTLKKANKFENSKMGFLALYHLSDVLYKMNAKNDAFKIYEKIFATQEKRLSKHRQEMSYISYNLGVNNLKLGNIYESKKQLYYTYKNIDGDPYLKIKATFKMAEAFYESCNYDRSKAWYKEAFLYTKLCKFPDQVMVGDAYSNLADIYMDKWNNKKGIKYYEKAIKCYKKSEFSDYYLDESQIGNQILVHNKKEETYKKLISIYEEIKEHPERIKKLKLELKGAKFIPIKVIKKK